MAYAFFTIFVLACGVALAAWVVCVWNLVRVPLNLRPNVGAWALGNPFNYLFKPEALTPTGVVARRRVGISLLVFLAALVIGACAGLLAKWLA
jgi:hypothetical protein